MWWVKEGKEEKDWAQTVSLLELPPKGYDGPLTGTSWDPDTMLQGYGRGTIEKGVN